MMTAAADESRVKNKRVAPSSGHQSAVPSKYSSELRVNV